METNIWFGFLRRVELTIDQFGGDEGSEKLIEAIRARDEPAISTYVEGNPNCGQLLVVAILFVSHETPYSHVIPPTTLALVKKHTTPLSLISTIMTFWQQRPSTGIVLSMKYVDLGVLSLVDVVSWLLEHDSWMSKSWGWEIIETCVAKADGRISRQKEQSKSHNVIKPGSETATVNTHDLEGKEELVGDKPTEDSMQIDPKNGIEEDKAGEDSVQLDSIAGITNGALLAKEKQDMFERIVSGVGSCYERQREWDRYWLKEWFKMIVRRFNAQVAGLEGVGWVGEMLASAQEYRRHLD
jgi:hypothetical protein